MAEEISRREFVKQSAAGTAAIVAASSALSAAPAVLNGDKRHQLVAALGDQFVPSKPGDPGYKDLEQYGITDYVLQKLKISDETVEAFNNSAKLLFEGKTFLELDPKQREQYIEAVIDGKQFADEKVRGELQSTYRVSRLRIMTVFYQNYPENEVKRNAQGETILKPGELHQITNPNTKKVVTGWDIAGFEGPLSWEEEEQRRKEMKKILPFWLEADLVKRNTVTAAPAVKTAEGKDYYDVVVVGGGTAGCIVAGRLAERGMNPKTGDRLRVAMIEGGDDWTIRDPAFRPGYSYPIRRRMITNIIYDELGPEAKGPGYTWPFDGENFRLVGGCSVHFGGNTFLPVEEDLDVWRQTSGVDWTFGKFADAIEEIRRMYYVTGLPEETYSKGVRMFNESARGLGYDPVPSTMARFNCIDCGFCGEGYLCKYDSKGNSLPFAYIGLNNGLKVIANADAEKIIIEKPAGGRPVATGVVYKDNKTGAMHEVRAARVIVAAGAAGTPLLLYRSGYGPRELLGDKLIVENKNVGAHLDGDTNSNQVAALFPEPIYPPRGQTGFTLFTTQKHPWKELNVQMRVPGLARVSGVKYPHQAALHEFAPEFGWKHKEFMRDGRLRTGMITNRLQLLPWEWRVLPNGKFERLSLDEQKIEAVAKDAAELSYAIYEKMSLKPVRVSRRLRSPKTYTPGHNQGSARAGENRDVSVCSSDFDCHDIDNLLITSGASMPRTTFGHGAGPIAVGAAYAWRRILANHFTKGSSTKGFA